MIQSITQANQIIQKQQAQIDQLVSELTSSLRKINRLQHQVEQLLRRIYGRKSEKMDPNQLMFDSFMFQGIELNKDVEAPITPESPPAPRRLPMSWV